MAFLTCSAPISLAIIMTDVFLHVSDIFSHASYPSICCISEYMSTMSGMSLPANSTAAGPVSASPTTSMTFSVIRYRFMSSRVSLLFSAIRTLIFLAISTPPLFGNHYLALVGYKIIPYNTRSKVYRIVSERPERELYAAHFLAKHKFFTLFCRDRNRHSIAVWDFLPLFSLDIHYLLAYSKNLYVL